MWSILNVETFKALSLWISVGIPLLIWIIISEIYYWYAVKGENMKNSDWVGIKILCLMGSFFTIIGLTTIIFATSICIYIVLIVGGLVGFLWLNYKIGKFRNKHTRRKINDI